MCTVELVDLKEKEVAVHRFSKDTLNKHAGEEKAKLKVFDHLGLYHILLEYIPLIKSLATNTNKLAALANLNVKCCSKKFKSHFKKYLPDITNPSLGIKKRLNKIRSKLN